MLALIRAINQYAAQLLTLDTENPVYIATQTYSSMTLSSQVSSQESAMSSTWCLNSPFFIDRP